MIKQCLLLAGMGFTGVAMAQVPSHLDVANQIRQEAFHHSQVMKTLAHLTEDIGPRLTASPQKYAANAWTMKQFKEWGLANVHKEAFADFGRGWEFTNATVQELSPRQMPLRALPKAWSPGTNGTVEGEVVKLSVESPEDLEKYKGKLKGKIVLLSDAREYKRSEDPDSDRYTKEELADLHTFEIRGDFFEGAKPDWRTRYAKYMKLRKALPKFLADEGVLATISISPRDDGILRVGGNGTRKAEDAVGVPALVMMSEHYNELVRDIENKRPVKLRINVAARFTSDKDLPGYNVMAEIPGHGRDSDEIVMLGAHLDSWHTGTGASDNGAGVAVMMEAMRILKKIGVRPNRTIRVALWGGEEQGLIGSRAYVKDHFAAYPETKDPKKMKLPSWMRKPEGKLQFKPEYEDFSAYFNLDNGSGRIRGIYAQENVAVMPIFKTWLKPFHDVGATEVVSGNTGSTDHVSFDRVGLPGFQFVQDWLDYFPHVHHTNLDTLDHVSEEDLKQASAVVAWFVYKTAMRADKLPRKPLADR